MKAYTLHFTETDGGSWCAVIPAELQKLLGRQVTATLWKDRSIRLYTEDEWVDVMTHIERLTEGEAKRLRPFFALAELCYSGGDAITLHDTLRCHAGIETDAVLEIGDDEWLLRRG